MVGNIAVAKERHRKHVEDLQPKWPWNGSHKHGITKNFVRFFVLPGLTWLDPDSHVDQPVNKTAVISSVKRDQLNITPSTWAKGS